MRRLATSSLYLLLLAIFLDGQIRGGSYLLGTAGLLPQVFWSALPLPMASALAFAFGLLLDGSHYSLPFGLSAFFCLAVTFCLQLLHQHIFWDLPARLPLTVPATTVAYYVALSLAFGRQTALSSALLACLGSCAFNCLAWALFFRERTPAAPRPPAR
ncbi:MAG: hypothetical protein LBB14_00360 [Puniceicoccales bacterium]|nr:hypothetical protein [Puniceicoccales bacterium]